MADKCKECGCVCVNCGVTGLQKKYDIVDDDDDSNGEMHLHLEIENLRQRLLERDSHIVTMETQFLNEADKFPNGELASMKEEMLIWQDKYTRLYESHKRVQKVNQNLEDKLLRIVDKCETEKSAFTKDIATLSHRLADANYTIHRLMQDNEKYRNDVNLAIQLLQCKPSNFVGQRYDSLPSEVQAKVRSYVAQKRVTPSSNESSIHASGGATTGSGGVSENFKSITVPISTFPPTAMVYNVTKTSNTDKDSDEESDDSKPPVDIVSAAIMAKVLEERERERVFAKHCDTCTCHRSILTNDVETQTFEDNCDRRDDDDDDDDKKKKKIFYKDNNVICNSEFDSGNNSENIVVDNFNITAINNRQDRRKDFTASKAAAGYSVNGKLINNIDIEYIDERKTRKKNFGNGKILTKEEKKTTTTTTTTSCQYSPIKQSSMIYGNKKNFSSLSTSSATNFKQSDKSSVRQTSRVSLSKKAEHKKKKEDEEHKEQRNEESVNGVYRFAKTKSSEWTKYEKLPSQDIDLIDLKNGAISEMEIDVINKRIWRTNNDDDDDDVDNVLSSSSSSRENRKMISDFIIGKTSSEKNCFNVINDRVWKKSSIDEVGGGSSSRSDSGLGVAIKSVGLTLIEVKNSPTVYKSKDDKTTKEKESSIGLDMQSEDTASPSFSSDSLAISSSDPPSTSSEFCNPKRLADVKKTLVNNNDNINNNNNNNNINSNKNNFNSMNRNNFTSSNSLMSNWQDRTTGPRGCSMRITPGSKNILLDNAGNYKTILYTSSGTNNGYNDRLKPKNTPLVHHNVAKSNRSGASTSTSTTSEENSPDLPNDNSQLQRVAEWIKASGPSDVVDEGGEVKSTRYVESSEKKSGDGVDKLRKELREGNNEDDEAEVEMKEANDSFEKNKKKKKLDRNFVRGDDDDDNSLSFNVVNNEKENNAADLISFESSNDDVDNFHVSDKKLLSSVVDSRYNIAKDDSFNVNFKSDESSSSVSNNISVKVTREMEETYLKLAASLDPANLKLSNSDNTDITLEKYRKKYKKK